MKRKPKIGIIGFGNMGSAIFERIKKDYAVIVYDKAPLKLRIPFLNITKNNIELAKDAEVLILAVKPQDFKDLLIEIAPYVKERLVISIAAGISTRFIEKFLKGARVVRVMPNLAVRIGKGMIWMVGGKTATKEDMDFSKKIFKRLGKVLSIGEEAIDKATALSGSGPGFLYAWGENKTLAELKRYAKESFLPTLKRTAKKLGFSNYKATFLAKATVEGSLAFLKSSQLSCLELKNRVASKGGTTEAGLKVLSAGGSLEEAFFAAFKRAEELAKAY